MYTRFFGLHSEPFSISPDPEFLFLSEHHREALAHLHYGITEHGGFVLLVGEVGTGKTTLLRSVIADLDLHYEIALLLNPASSVEEFLQDVLEELDLPLPEEKTQRKALIDTLNQHLLRTFAKGRQTVLLIDEAQSLSRDVLESIRLLTNLETHQQKLLRIVLIGQPELLEMLTRHDMRQLAQRITVRYLLPPLNRSETEYYIGHRLRVAGGSERLFSQGAINAIYGKSGGIPRLINVLSDRALLSAYAADKPRVEREHVLQAAKDSVLHIEGQRQKRFLLFSFLLACVVLFVVVALFWFFTAASWRSPSVPTELDKFAQKTEVLQKHPVKNTEQEATQEPASVPLPPVVEVLPAQFPTQATLLPYVLQSWELTLPSADQSVCAMAESHGLRCYERQGDFSALLALNRPALLTVGYQNSEGWLFLKALRDQSAIVFDGKQDYSVALTDLAERYRGRFWLLLPQLNSMPTLAPGQRGEAVQWLRQRLCLYEGQKLFLCPNQLTYDQDLAKKVKQFQSNMGLKADALVGEDTFLLLNNLVPEPGSPVLQEKR